MLLAWIRNVQDRVGTGIFFGIGTGFRNFRDSRECSGFPRMFEIPESVQVSRECSGFLRMFISKNVGIQVECIYFVEYDHNFYDHRFLISVVGFHFTEFE